MTITITNADVKNIYYDIEEKKLKWKFILEKETNVIFCAYGYKDNKVVSIYYYEDGTIYGQGHGKKIILKKACSKEFEVIKQEKVECNETIVEENNEELLTPQLPRALTEKDYLSKFEAEINEVRFNKKLYDETDSMLEDFEQSYDSLKKVKSNEEQTIYQIKDNSVTFYLNKVQKSLNGLKYIDYNVFVDFNYDSMIKTDIFEYKLDKYVFEKYSFNFKNQLLASSQELLELCTHLEEYFKDNKNIKLNQSVEVLAAESTPNQNIEILDIENDIDEFEPSQNIEVLDVENDIDESSQYIENDKNIDVKGIKNKYAKFWYNWSKISDFVKIVDDTIYFHDEIVCQFDDNNYNVVYSPIEVGENKDGPCIRILKDDIQIENYNASDSEKYFLNVNETYIKYKEACYKYENKK